MAQRNSQELFCQVQSELQALAARDGLPFRELLSPERILAALEKAQVKFRDRIYNPIVTLWAFLSQAVSKDFSCSAAVSRVLADRVASGLPACSSDPSSYGTGRTRLPLQPVQELTREAGQSAHRRAPDSWLCWGRRVSLVDGTTNTMADTEKNQKEYPQSSEQKPGLGFPCMRILAVLSLAVGTVQECVYGPCKGKKTGELSLFRQIWHVFERGDIVLADRLYDSYRDMAQLRERGVDSIFGKKQSRQVDFRRGRRLGPDDHIVVWRKPKYDKNRYDSREEWEALPDRMEVREMRLTVRRPGCKTRQVVIVTTLLDAEKYTFAEVLDLFQQRWNCELDLRSIKRALNLHHSLCQSPEMVHKELWVHLLAYNLIRVRMAQAAAVHNVPPRQLSFTGTKTLIQEFARQMKHADSKTQERLEVELLKAIATRRVGNRPGRKEPRAVKKRQQKYSYLTKPRAKARKGLAA